MRNRCSTKIYASDTLDVLQQEIVDEKYLIVDGSDNIDKKENHVIKDLSAKGRYVYEQDHFHLPKHLH